MGMRNNAISTSLESYCIVLFVCSVEGGRRRAGRAGRWETQKRIRVYEGGIHVVRQPTGRYMLGAAMNSDREGGVGRSRGGRGKDVLGG